SFAPVCRPALTCGEGYTRAPVPGQAGAAAVITGPWSRIHAPTRRAIHLQTPTRGRHCYRPDQRDQKNLRRNRLGVSAEFHADRSFVCRTTRDGGWIAIRFAGDQLPTMSPPLGWSTWPVM